VELDLAVAVEPGRDAGDPIAVDRDVGERGRTACPVKDPGSTEHRPSHRSSSFGAALGAALAPASIRPRNTSAPLVALVNR
jgi:hypothetical protein